MIVLIATSWNNASGGISAFNFALAKALGRLAPGHVTCAIVGEIGTAGARTEDGVLLVSVHSGRDAKRPALECGDEILDTLRKQGFSGAVEHWIGHDLVTGPAAVLAGERHGGCSVVIHHMDYLAYQNLGGGRGNEAAENHEAQIDLFSRADLAVGVGARLARTAEELGAARVITLLPGFPEITPLARRKVGPLSAVTAGRFGAKSEPVKQVRLAVAAFGYAIRSADRFIDTLPDATLELLPFGLSRAG